MIKAVLDTNILISAFLSDGIPRKLLERASQGKFINVTSPFILDEEERILSDKLDVSEHLIAKAVERVLSASDVINPTSELDVVEDKADNEVLATALDSGSQYIVTGDHGLLELGEYESIKIVRPRKFLNELNKELEGS